MSEKLESSVKFIAVYFFEYWNFEMIFHCYLLLIISVLFKWILWEIFNQVKGVKFPTFNLLLDDKVP